MQTFSKSHEGKEVHRVQLLNNKKKFLVDSYPHLPFPSSNIMSISQQLRVQIALKLSKGTPRTKGQV